MEPASTVRRTTAGFRAVAHAGHPKRDAEPCPPLKGNTKVHVKTRSAFGLLACGALAAALTTAAAAGSAAASASSSPAAAAAVVRLHLTPSSAQLAGCMPKAKVDIKVELKTDKVGFDDFEVSASGLPPKTAFTIFLLQQADSPFGAAEYIGDITSNDAGRARNEFKLIVQEAFSSSILNGQRVRTDLNQVGMWFADPAGDDFCLGVGQGPVTPFDGDNEAGVQAFNSLNTTPLPAP
jgi:hypothetical protein